MNKPNFNYSASADSIYLNSPNIKSIKCADSSKKSFFLRTSLDLASHALTNIFIFCRTVV